MAARLIAEEGLLKELVLYLDDGDHWTIGRDPDSCELLVEDPSASRQHARCDKTESGMILTNLSATNPTIVNEEPLKEPRLLQHGDAVRIGDTLFRFYSEDTIKIFEEEASDNQPEALENAKNAENAPMEETTSPEENAPVESQAEAVNAVEEPEDEEGQAEEVPAEEAQDQDQEQEVDQKAEHEEAEAVKTVEEEEAVEQESAVAVEEEVVTDIDTNTDIDTDTVFNSGESLHGDSKLAEINFDMLDAGKWLLKVIGGPNNGAEFSMQPGMSYTLGTDPNACDIVFQDNSVSRQHARLTVSEDETLTIEDLRSRNGTIVDGEKIEGKRLLAPNAYVVVGTTSFVVYDREGEMQTIISPLLPSIVKVLKEEEAKKEEYVSPKIVGPTEAELAAEKEKKEDEAATAAAAAAEVHHQRISHLTSMGILIAILVGLFVVVGIGISSLFKPVPLVVENVQNNDKSLADALLPFPTVKYSFNNATGRLLLVGHVLTSTDKSQLLYNLQGFKFITDIDDSGVIIDEYVWNEANQVLARNPDWKGVSVQSPTPGRFVLTGYLKTREQSEQVWDYITRNFTYIDLLENQLVVEEDLLSAVHSVLVNHGFSAVKAQISNGELVLTGNILAGKRDELQKVVTQIQGIQGIRVVKNLVAEVAAEEAVVNISSKYAVTGSSTQDNRITVVINGRILTQGDTLDGMTITQIKPHMIFLQRDATTYRIDF